jgi:uroporphyrinogen-III synthase
LSSERCVIAVQNATTECDLGHWKKKLVVCAGEASAQKTREALGLEPHLGEKHRAEGIIDLLADSMKTGIENCIGKEFNNIKLIEHPSPTLMLYPCGEIAANKDTMVAGLAKRGIGCESVPVYKTEPNPELKIILTRVFNEKVRFIYLYFCV